MFIWLKYWLPLAIVITFLSGLIYIVGQQNIRMSANDPQIQMAEDATYALNQGQSFGVVLSTNLVIDISKSLSPYIILYDKNGDPIASSARINNKTPGLPKGVFKYVDEHGEDRITWQTREGIRSAIVVTKFNNGKESGYVVSGRSLRESEKRIIQLTVLVGIGWLFTLIASFFMIVLLSFFQEKKK